MKRFIIVDLALFLVCTMSVHAGEEKKQCPQACPLLYAPVCGYNQECYKIFGNSCLMEAENCRNDDCFEAVEKSLCQKGCVNLCKSNYY